MEKSKMATTNLTWAVLVVIIVLLMAINTLIPSYAQHTPTVKAYGSWYLGEGAVEGTSLKYKIENGGINNGTAYNMTITLEERDENGFWLANLVVSNNQEVLSQDVVLNSNLSPLQSTDVPDSFQPYLTTYENTLLWFGGWGSKEDPVPLRLNSWGRLACEGCIDRSIQPRAVENVTLSAGTFEATIVTRCNGCDTKTWIVDGFPYPVKEQVSTAWNGDTKTAPHRYELVQVIGTEVIPEFVSSLMIITLVIGTILVISLAEKHRQHRLKTFYG
jgi:hypothetical protein